MRVDSYLEPGMTAERVDRWDIEAALTEYDRVSSGARSANSAAIRAVAEAGSVKSIAANHTSNALYQRIGYVHGADFTGCKFSYGIPEGGQEHHRRSTHLPSGS